MDVKYSIGNIINNITITIYGAKWVFEISERALCKVYDYLTTNLYT